MLRQNKYYVLLNLVAFIGYIEYIICHQCNHSSQNADMIISYDDQDFKQEINGIKKDRLLFQEYYQPIRITTDMLRLSALTLGQIKSIDLLSKAAAQFFADTISIKRRKEILYFPWSDNGLKCNDIVVSSTDANSGILNSDLHIYYTYENDPTKSYIANAIACVVQSRDNRPIFGRIKINIAQFSLATNRDFNKYLDVFIHEYMHILGFSSSLYKYWKDSNGNAQDPTLFSVGYFLSGTNNIIRTPNLLQAARSHYNCPYLEGIPLENEGDSGSIGSHFEKLALYNDLMTSNIGKGKQIFSIFDIALLKDTGWYQTNDSQALSTVWGYNQGCDFLKQACNSSKSFNEFCSLDLQIGCDQNQLGKGSCGVDYPFTTTCKQYLTTVDCTDTTQNNPASTSSEVMAKGSRCFASSLIITGQPTKSIDAACYQTTCLSTPTTIQVTVGSITNTCTTSKQQLTFTGYSGVLVCPNDLDMFCANKQALCPDCSFNGYCNSAGTCTCVSGFFGSNCECNGSNSQKYNSGVYTYDANCKPLININCLSPNIPFCTICKDGYYVNPTDGYCLPCQIGFAKCQVPLSWQCLIDCPPGYFANDTTQTCDSCGSLCNRCNNISQCLECKKNDGTNDICSSPITGSNLVTCSVHLFTDNSYITDSYQCGNCDPSCSTLPSLSSCYGPSSTQCKTASSTKCPSGQIADSTSNCVTKQTGCTFPIILPTHKSCCPAGEFQVTPFECRKFDTIMASQILYIQQYSQVSQCTNNYYAMKPNEYSSNIYYCLKCHNSCETCTDYQDSSCIRCAAGFYKYKSNCITSCPFNTYPNDNRECIACDTSCSGCTGSTNLDCINCAIAFSKQSTACLPSCGYGKYLDSNYACQSCLTDCIECENSTSCIQCKAGYYWYEFGLKCVQACDIGFYVDESNKKCLPCDASCYTCSAGTKYDCLSCSTPKKFKYGQCVSACDSQQVEKVVVDSNGVITSNCIYCHYSCKTCTDIDEYSCSTCNDFHYKLNITPLQCVQFCPDDKYLVPDPIIPDLYTCETCPCEKCDEKGNCLKCPVGLYYDYTKPATNPCVATCPSPGTFQDEINRTCTKCNANCLVCDSDTVNGCKVCNAGYQLALGKQCIPIISCSSKYWFDGVKCVSCISNCSVCYASDTCSICDTGYAYNSSTQKCVLDITLTCPEGQYYDSNLLKTCVNCPDNCLKCDSATNCTLYKIQCHYTCADCVGETDNSCSSCGSTRRLDRYFINSNIGQCKCNSNYSDFGNQECKASKAEQIQYQTTGVGLILQSTLSSLLSFVSFDSFYFRTGSDYSQYIGQLSYVSIFVQFNIFNKNFLKKLKRHNLVGFDKTLETFRYYNFNLLLKSPFSSPSYQKQRLLAYSSTSERNRDVIKIEEIHQSSSFFSSCFSSIILTLVSLGIMVGSRFIKTSADDMPDAIQAEQMKKWRFISYFQLLIPSYIFSFTVQELSLCIFLQFRNFDASGNDDYKEIGLAFAILFLIYIIVFIGYQIVLLPNQKEEDSLIVSIYYQQVRKKLCRFAARYYAFENLKKVFYSFLIVVAYDEPLVPIIFMFFGEILFTICFIWYKPYFDKELNVLTILIKIFIIIITLIMFIMIGQPEESSAQLNGIFAIVVISNSLIVLTCLFSLYMIFTRTRQSQFLKKIFPEQTVIIPQALNDTSIIDQDYLKNNTNFISYTNNNVTQMQQYTDNYEPKAVQDYQSRKKMLSNVNRKKLINYDGIKKEHELNIQNQQKALQELQQRGKLYQQSQLQQKQQYFNSKISSNQQPDNSPITEKAEVRNKSQSNRFFQKSKNGNNSEQL